MTDLQRQFIEHCIETDDVHSFYTWDVWERLRLRVLAIDHNECQRCKYVYHRQRAATVVHHRQQSARKVHTSEGDLRLLDPTRYVRR